MNPINIFSSPNSLPNSLPGDQTEISESLGDEFAALLIAAAPPQPQQPNAETPASQNFCETKQTFLPISEIPQFQTNKLLTGEFLNPLKKETDSLPIQTDEILNTEPVSQAEAVEKTEPEASEAAIPFFETLETPVKTEEEQPLIQNLHAGGEKIDIKLDPWIGKNTHLNRLWSNHNFTPRASETIEVVPVGGGKPESVIQENVAVLAKSNPLKDQPSIPAPLFKTGILSKENAVKEDAIISEPVKENVKPNAKGVGETVQTEARGKSESFQQMQSWIRDGLKNNSADIFAEYEPKDKKPALEKINFTNLAISEKSENVGLENQIAEVQESAQTAEQLAKPLLELAQEVGKTREPRAVRIKLNPEELGEVEIRLETGKNGNLTARITTETETARQTLSNGLNQLQQALEKSGWQVDKLEITSNQSSGQSFSQNGGNQSQNEKRSFSFHSETSIGAKAEVDSSAARTDRIVSVLA